MILAILSAAMLSQTCNTPTGITTFTEPLCANATASQYRVLANTTSKCLAFARDGAWRCLAEVGAPSTGVRATSTPPAPTQVGDAYVDTTQVPPCLRLSVDGSTWGACLAPPMATDLERVPAYATAPSLPAGSATLNRGARYFDTTLGCTRSTTDGLTWGACLTLEACTNFTASGLSVPVLGITTTPVNVTLAGARVGSPCHVTRPVGGAVVATARSECQVTAANAIAVQWVSNSGPVGALLSIPNGTYSVCTEVVR